MSEQVTVELLKGFLEAFNHHDLDAIMGYFADDCVFYMPREAKPRGDRYVGKEEVRAELAVRDSLKEWLEEEGFTVAMAGSGAESLAALASEPYHLMLLDIKMPGMDGVEVLERAKALSPELTVVMMTAYATVETAVEAMKIGALDYLSNPSRWTA